MSELRPVGFVHIPKTAGMSVRAALLDHYPAHRVGPTRFDERLFGGFDRFDTFSPALRAETMLPSDPAPTDTTHLLQLGHLSLQGMLRLLPADRVFTVLREPRARLLSHHLYWAVRPSEVNEAFGDYQVQRLATAGLAPFLHAAAAAHQHDNLQCRMLVHAPGLVPPDAPIDPAHHDEVAARALAAIEGLGLVALVEDPAMWEQLSAFVGHPLRNVRTNVTEADEGRIGFRGPQLDADTVALVEERNGADLVLYRAVVARRWGLSPAEAAAFADRHFVSQAERYGRVIAAAERPAPAAATEPSAPAPLPAPGSSRRPRPWRRRA